MRSYLLQNFSDVINETIESPLNDVRRVENWIT